MAIRQIQETLCDPCHSKGKTIVEDVQTYRIVVGEARYEVELCPACSKPVRALLHVLEQHGRKATPAARGRRLAAQDGARRRVRSTGKRVECLTCADGTTVSLAGRWNHAKARHGASASTLKWGPVQGGGEQVG